MYKSAFQELTRAFMHVSRLPLPYFDLKNQIIKYFFSHQNMVGEDLRKALTCVPAPETHVYACLRSSPPYFCKKPFYEVLGFFLSKYGGEDLRHAKT